MPVPRRCTPTFLTCARYFSSFLRGVTKNKTGEGGGGVAEINQWLLGVFPPQESIIPVISLALSSVKMLNLDAPFFVRLFCERAGAEDVAAAGSSVLTSVRWLHPGCPQTPGGLPPCQ